MASSTDVQSQGSVVIATSINCNDVSPTWDDLCADISEISFSGGDRSTSETNTFCTQNEVITLVGNKNPVEATVTALYTNVAADLWQVMWDEFDTIEGSCDVGVRWTYGDEVAGNVRFTLCGVLTQVELPSASASSADPTTGQIIIRGSVTKEVLT